MKVYSYIKKFYGNKNTALQAPRLSLCFNVVMILYVVSRIWYTVPLIIANIADVNSWSISEFLVNYHGGFIRRGLMGEILYFVVSQTGWDVRCLIVPLCLVCFALVLALSARILRHYGIKWWILALPICFAFMDYCLVRKDFLNILIIVGMFKVYNNTRLAGVAKMLVVLVLSSLMLLINEASFFIIMPFMYLLVIRDKTLNAKLLYRYLFVGLSLALLFVILESTGDASVPQRIHSSWLSLDPAIFTPEQMGLTVEAVGWGARYALRFNHSILLVSSLSPDTMSRVIEVVKFVVMILLGLYILLRYPYVARSQNVRPFTVSTGVYITLVLLQLLSLSPMFLGLSNDYSRVFMYWILSTLIIVYYIPETVLRSIFSSAVTKASATLSDRLSYVLPNNIYTLMAIMCVSYVYAPITNVLCGDYFFIKTLLYDII